MLIAMTLAAILCIFIGSYPWVLYDLLPHTVSFTPFDSTHVIAQIQLLLFAGLGVFWLMRIGWYPPEIRAINLDADWTYRWLAPRIVRASAALILPTDAALRRHLHRRLQGFLDALFRHHGPQGVLARNWPTGSMVLWVAIFLAVYLALYYL